MKRIIIIGSGGAGKSTFSRQLHEITGIKLIHLDQTYWLPNWTEPPKQEWKKQLAKILDEDEWILDGNFGSTLEMRMAACDTVFWLDLPPAVCVYQALKRNIKYYGKSRPDMTEGCNEKIDFKFLHWVATFKHSKSGIELKAAIEKFRDSKNIIRLKSRKEIEKYLAGLN